MDNRDRVMVLTITRDVLLAILQNRIRLADFDLPADIKLIEAGYSVPMRGFDLLLWSAQFEPVPPGEMPPRLPLIRCETVE